MISSANVRHQIAYSTPPILSESARGSENVLRSPRPPILTYSCLAFGVYHLPSDELQKDTAALITRPCCRDPTEDELPHACRPCRFSPATLISTLGRRPVSEAARSHACVGPEPPKLVAAPVLYYIVDAGVELQPAGRPSRLDRTTKLMPRGFFPSAPKLLVFATSPGFEPRIEAASRNKPGIKTPALRDVPVLKRISTPYGLATHSILKVGRDDQMAPVVGFGSKERGFGGSFEMRWR